MPRDASVISARYSDRCGERTGKLHPAADSHRARAERGARDRVYNCRNAALTSEASTISSIARFGESGFDSFRVYVNDVYITGAPFKLAAATAIGGAAGLVGGLVCALWASGVPRDGPSRVAESPRHGPPR